MEDLLPYYERELVLLRQYGREFAERFPKVAAQLRMSGEGCGDPQVERLIQSVALLAARTSKRLDDDYPKFTESLLEILFPHYLRPFPSCAIVRAESSRQSGAEWHVMPRGTEIESVPVQGVRCRFRTAYDLAIGPVRIAAASFSSIIAAPADVQLPAAANAVLRMTFEMPHLKSSARPLRIFMDGEPSFCATLRDMLFMRTVAAYVEAEDGSWTALPSVPVEAVGFAEREALIPFGSRSQPAYRLLTEYFAFPEKFNFFQLDLAAACELIPAACSRFTLHLVLAGVRPDSHAARIMHSLSADNLLLGCTPVINLFAKHAEPIAVTQRTSDYAVVADSNHASAYEIYSVDSVTMQRTSGKTGVAIEFRPFYSLRHGEGDALKNYYWLMRHDDIVAATSPGYEKKLTLVDADMEPLGLEKNTMSIELTCTNRELPVQLRSSLDHGVLVFPRGAGGITVRFARYPTQPCRFSFGPGLQWRLISHLALNHHALAPEGLAAFREMLTLYDVQQNATSQRQICGVVGLEHLSTTVWLRHPRGATLVHGTQVRMTLDEDAFVGSGVHLFVEVIDCFLGMHVQVNSFIELVVLSNQSGKELARCKPRSGQACLV